MHSGLKTRSLARTLHNVEMPQPTLRIDRGREQRRAKPRQSANFVCRRRRFSRLARKELIAFQQCWVGLVAAKVEVQSGLFLCADNASDQRLLQNNRGKKLHAQQDATNHLLDPKPQTPFRARKLLALGGFLAIIYSSPLEGNFAETTHSAV